MIAHDRREDDDEDRPPTPATADLPRLLDITGTADHLGVNPRYLRRLVSERRIPFIKWGHLIRFDPDEIAAWLNHARRPSSAPSSRRSL